MRNHNLKYHKESLKLVESIKEEHNCASILDVGGWDGTFLTKTSLKDRTIVEIKNRGAAKKGIKLVNEDFLKWETDSTYDIVICMQVLEHLENHIVAAFAKKLFDMSEHIVISVPYKWKKGFCKYHKQDPVDYKKLFKWTGRMPDKVVLVQDDSDRIICYYKN